MPETKQLLPKFLTKGILEKSFEMVSSTLQYVPGLSQEPPFHVVVLVPMMVVKTGNYPNYPTQPHVLHEYSRGNKKQWRYDYAEIAQCKALQLWHGRADGGTDIMPHLLFPGDSPFWGGVKRNGIVVACSGLDEWYDRMISGMVIDTCIALAYHEWMRSTDKADSELCFLT